MAHQVNLRRSESAKKAIVKRGYVGPEHMLWSHREDKIVRAYYPDYERMQRRLSHRTINAITHRAAVLGVARKIKAWTGTEVSKLQRLWRNTPLQIIYASFPDRSIPALHSKARKLNLIRPRPRTMSGVRTIDDIRRRALELGYSMPELDAILRTGRYFQSSCLAGFRPNPEFIARAVEFLGGELVIQWAADEAIGYSGGRRRRNS